MNFSSAWFRILRLLLFPVALIYGFVVKLRNFLYDKKIIKSVSFNFPVISIGNLSVGGTGKSPMVEYLLRLLLKDYKVATLSRGYKRKTRGYTLASAKTTALDIGDEPMQFYTKFPEAYVAVGEERAIAIPQILFDRPDTNVLILDDAMQHRAVEAGLDILLTECNNLFTNDVFLPTGSLRDARKSYKRAEIIIITKCAPDLKEEQKNEITKKIKLLPHQHIFFSCIRYGLPYHILTGQTIGLSKKNNVLLLCAIANPKPIKTYIEKAVDVVDEMYYRDHYIFRIDDLKKIIRRFDDMEGTEEKIILVTEKDAMRLTKFAEHLKDLPVYVLPIESEFLFNGAGKFNIMIKDFISKFKENRSIDYGKEE